MSERYCVRGCKQRGAHYATCAWFGIEQGAVPYLAFGSPGAPEKCTGCAERPAREQALICDGCYFRLRSLVRDSGDLLGRLASLADPMKATPTDKAPGGRASAVEPPAPVDADLLDARIDISRTIHAWDRFAAPRSIEQALDDIVNDLEDVERMSAGWLDRNDAVDGVRPFWSVADAWAKWGPERRTKNEPEWIDDAAVEETRPTPEWNNPLVGWPDAVRIAGSDSTLRRWIKREEIEIAGQIVIAGITTRLFRSVELVATRERMEAQKTSGLVQNAETKPANENRRD
ncbi:hypothetical protein [Microbacterium maritypicum]|uniref:hypothetical protein n=1 Tax=Microbacterium maritypicum TaxID=33918 RepID=UPI0037F8B114